MRVRNEAEFEEKKEQIMRACYECYAENGLFGTGIATLASAAGVSKANLYTYFHDVDDLIIQSTEWYMTHIEDDFLEQMPQRLEDILGCIDKIPYWTAKVHGKQYRLMYQVYTHPKYHEYGRKFFLGVNERYTQHAKSLAEKTGIPYTTLLPLIFVFIRSCVHFALYEDEFYLQEQLKLIKGNVQLLLSKFNE